ncbi:unnamed protein product [Scytosiphon promiscuus]
MAAAGSGNAENGGASLISEIGDNRMRRGRGSFSSSSSSSVSSASDVDAHSLSSAQDSVASTLSEPEVMPSNGGGMGSSDSLGNGVGAAARGKPHKRALSDDAPRVVEQETPSTGQQLRKACDLCTKRKRKCNGQHPCSQCIETGVRNQCIYSPRLKSGRKKKVRIDGVLYDEGTYGGELALTGGGAGGGGRRHTVDPSAGLFSASAAVGLAGHVENFFLATYLRDFNRIVPLTTESSVTEGMLEVLSPAVSSRGLATANPIKQSESRRQAKLAVFWGVVAMGSRILGASDEATARYLGLMRNALRECFDCNDKEVVQAYLLLSTVETMRGNKAAGKRYLDHAHTMHNGNAMGPEGQLLKDRSEQDESLDLVFQIYDQPDGAVCGLNRSAAVGGEWMRDPRTANGSPSSAVDQMIAQAMAPPSESHSSPLKALKYLSTACGLSSEVFDPTNKCTTVKQYLGEMDSALKGAHSLFVATDLGECITGVMMVKIWGGVTVLMRSWGKLEDREIGLAQVEEGVGYALTRPGLFTFPMWWHALHCAAVTLAHFGRGDTYMRLRETFNKNTFPGTEMPSIDAYSPGSICPNLGGSCAKLGYWLQVRGSMCTEPEWKPHFANGKLSEASENAAYAAALDRSSKCDMKPNGKEVFASTGAPDHPPPTPMSGADLVDGSPLRAALDAGLSEIGAQLDDLSNLEMLGSTDLDLDLSAPLGADFDISQLIQEPENAEFEANGRFVVSEAANGGGAVHADREASQEACHANVAAGVATAVAAAAAGSGKSPVLPSPVAVPAFAAAPKVGSVANAMQIPRNLVASRGRAENAAGGGARGAVVVGELARTPSFGISGPAAVSSMLRMGGEGVPSAMASSGGDLSRQSSLDINTIMQMVNSDEELKQNEGGTPDAIDNALEYGDGPAKEIFGVDLSYTE